MMIECPDVGCEAVLEPQLWPSIIPKKVFGRWENNAPKCKHETEKDDDMREKEDDISLTTLARTMKWTRCPDCNIHVGKTYGCSLDLQVSIPSWVACGCRFCYACGLKKCRCLTESGIAECRRPWPRNSTPAFNPRPLVCLGMVNTYGGYEVLAESTPCVHKNEKQGNEASIEPPPRPHNTLVNSRHEHPPHAVVGDAYFLLLFVVCVSLLLLALGDL
ncbi:hypothetical protein FNV43_RR08059 [Rhamnella rubrinervis]|uniref:RING-type domain-containing protein n=1 Tax=Rhamnella rubrinervis TaxID=2594499 RepID=A0A8K0HHV3_9ROSA|nr:hypothetical protein FNV43_RR08059 [Rhamnella rubrinervis]